MSQDWDQIDQTVRVIQDTFMRMKYCDGPVVIAPRGMALGGGCEAVMHGDAVRASAESYIGLVELGVGRDPRRRRLQGDGVPVLRIDSRRCEG